MKVTVCDKCNLGIQDVQVDTLGFEIEYYFGKALNNAKLKIDLCEECLFDIFKDYI